jgi:hypothetical protein
VPPLAAAPSDARRDVATMIGGHFGSDHLGPDVYEAVMRRARAAPEVYLGVLEGMLLGADDEHLSRIFPSAVLDAVSAVAPDRAKDARACALSRYEAALARAKVDANGRDAEDPVTYRFQRLEQQVASLR